VNDLALKARVSRYIIHHRLRSTNYRNVSRFIREIRLKTRNGTIAATCRRGI
jgi:hypothetical protein